MEDKKWHSLLALGNDCFHEKKWSQAELFYSKAYDLLASSYRENPTSAYTQMAWICVCHNLSTLYELTEKLTLALKFLTVPHQYLLDITKSPLADEEIKLIALQGLSLTLSPILMFTKKHPICDDCLESFTSIKSLSTENLLISSSAVH